MVVLAILSWLPPLQLLLNLVHLLLLHRLKRCRFARLLLTPPHAGTLIATSMLELLLSLLGHLVPNSLFLYSFFFFFLLDVEQSSLLRFDGELFLLASPDVLALAGLHLHVEKLLLEMFLLFFFLALRDFPRSLFLFPLDCGHGIVRSCKKIQHTVLLYLWLIWSTNKRFLFYIYV